MPTPTLKTVIYISGPMRGIEDFNFPAFDEAASTLRNFGYDVISPAESFGGRTDLDAETYLRYDIESLLRADAVVLLPGWRNSSGVKAELTVAAAIGLPVYELSEFVIWGNDAKRENVSFLLEPIGQKEGTPTTKTEQETALQVANRIVHGARQKDYGHPYEDFSKTAAFWSTLFGVQVKPWQVAQAMALLKISRLMQTPTHYDSIVDVAGYMGTYEMVTDRAVELGEL